MELLSINEESQTALVTLSADFKNRAPDLFKLIMTKHLIMKLEFGQENVSVLTRGRCTILFANTKLKMTPRQEKILKPLVEHLSITSHLVKPSKSKDEYWLTGNVRLTAMPLGTVYLLNLTSTSVLKKLLNNHKHLPKKVDIAFFGLEDKKEEEEPPKQRYDAVVTMLYLMIVTGVVVAIQLVT